MHRTRDLIQLTEKQENEVGNYTLVFLIFLFGLELEKFIQEYQYANISRLSFTK